MLPKTLCSYESEAISCNKIMEVEDFEKTKSSTIEEEERKNLEINDQFLSEYQDEIYQNLLIDEIEYLGKIKENYFLSQSQITPNMRTQLFDWLMDVNLKFGFNDETLILTYFLIDSYLSIRDVLKEDFQLVGIACLLISSKQNEIIIRRIKEFSYISDYTYSVNRIRSLEIEISVSINFSFLPPSPLSFLELQATFLGFREEGPKFALALFLIESFKLSEASLHFADSAIACAAAYVVTKVFGLQGKRRCTDGGMCNEKGSPNKKKRNTVKEAARAMIEQLRKLKVSGLDACRRKFEREEFYGVGQFFDEV